MPEFDTNVPHIARVYDYWLGGKDNFEVDRELGEKTIEAYPNIVFTVRTNRAFLARSVTYLARDAGVRQFLDIGTGQVSEMVRRLNESVAEKVTTRDHDGVVHLFDGLELVPPGVVRAPQWRPESELAEASPAALWAGVGRKP
jgi:hypothetical protein